MSESFIERLSRFTPDAGALDRDSLLYAAGRESAGCRVPCFRGSCSGTSSSQNHRESMLSRKFNMLSRRFRQALRPRSGSAKAWHPAVEYEADGKTLVPSQRTPLRYSRGKMEGRAADYGSQKNPPNPQMTPEEWIAEEKLMPGALQGYTYAEDPQP